MSARTNPFARPARPLADDALIALQQAIVKCGSQANAGEQLGISASAVNQVLKGKYRGDTEGIEQRIRGAFMRQTVACPVLGELSTKNCLDEQRRKVVYTNPLRVRLARACKTCPHRKDTTGATKC